MSEKKGNDTIVMEEKNRFSRLLEQLLGEAEIKSNTLAQELQYDVSYISKWINGRMLPSEKTEKRVLASIAHCIVSSASEDGLLCLQENYNIKEVDVLEGAVRDHLTAEYNYTREQQKEGDSSGTQKTRFFPELSIQQYLKQMKHPVLRRVKSLHIIMMTDLMAMDYESRIKFMSLDEQNIDKQRPFPEVHVSLILNLEDSRESCLCDVLFLLNLLSDSIHIDLRLYSSRRAYGRLIFAIRKEFVSTGMLEESGRCLSVTVSEEEGYCRQIYEAVQDYANQESLLFEKIDVPDVLRYSHHTEAYISSNTRWLVAQMTEKFMPDDLFEELVERIFGGDTSMPDIKEVLYRMHRLENSLLGTVRIRMLIYDSTFTSLVSQDEIDFCGCRVKLTADQKITLLEHVLEMMETYEQFEMRLIVGRLSEDILFSTDQSMFLSERSAFLRLMNVNGQMQFLVTVRKEMKTLLDRFYEEVWDMPADVILSDQRDIRERIEFAISLIRQMSQTN